MSFLNTIHRLSWAQVAAVTSLSLVLSGGLVVNRIMSTTTHLSSQAKPPEPTSIPLPNYPSQPPVITRLDPWFGKPADMVRLHGTNFGQAVWDSQLTLNHTPIDPSYISAWSDTAIDFTLPPGINSGAITLTVNHKATTSLTFSVYRTATDPQLSLDQTPAGWQLSLTNLDQPAGLSITYQLGNSLPQTQQFSYPFTNPPTFTTKPLILSVTLTDASGTILPLSQNPLNLLRP